MSIKGLFEKSRQATTVNKYLKKTAADATGEGIESAAHLSESIKRDRAFIPPLNYADPAEFVKYGSAEKYYSLSFDHISGSYPYDGSSLEQTKFYNDLNPLEKYILDEKYPKSTGYVTLGTSYGTPISHSSGYYSSSVEYIQTKGGPQIGTIYSTSDNRTNNLSFGGVSGSTVEFFVKKDWAVSQVTSSREVIFDVWNGNLSSSHDYGRFTLALSSEEQDRFFLTVQSGSTGFYEIPVPTTGGLDLGSSQWNQFSLSVDTNGTTTKIDLYQSGTCVGPQITQNSDINIVEGSLTSNIGALRTATSGTADSSDASMLGWGKLSGSIDEFRYWKSTRSSEDVGKNWYGRVYGGSDKYIANVDLGIYYRFNEGITENNAVDNIVLDYSGRISNGQIVNYVPESRNTGSAINEISVSSSVLTFREAGDPIIRNESAILINDRSNLVNLGIEYDRFNSSKITDMIPTWIIEEDKDSENELQNVTQVIASYFDTLHAQIGALTKVRNNEYISGSATGSISHFPHNDRILEAVGFDAPELFENATLIEKYLQKSDKIDFDQSLPDIKNSIYKNIYNNLTYILKSKGNEKSIRNTIRCFGIDDEVVSLNIYADNQDYNLDTEYKMAVSHKKYADFSGLRNRQDSFGSIYQHYNSDNPNSAGLIKGSNTLAPHAFTAEAEVIFPDRSGIARLSYEPIAVTDVSLFGFNTPAITDQTSTETAWANYGSDHGLRVAAVKSPSEYAEITSPGHAVKDAYFAVYDRAGTLVVSSSIFQNVYENRKWNFALSVRPEKYNFADGVFGTEIDSPTDKYILELYGVSYDTGIKRNSFCVTSSIGATSGSAIVASSKRMFLGAHRNNVTGTVTNYSDVRASSLLYWTDYIPTGTVDNHSKDVDNFGRKNPFRNTFGFQTGSNVNYIPEIETLALNWDFVTVTGSDTLGKFSVEDYSSGSAANGYASMYQGSALSSINLRQHTGMGNFFKANSQPVQKEYVETNKTQAPEYVASSDMIQVLDHDVEIFAPNRRPANYFFALEKSMYRSVSNRILQLFASIDDMNNLIGEPVNKYRLTYKSMEKLREIFFRKVENTPDLEKYVKYYKWIDSSIGQMVQQLFPASARHTEDIRTVIESHILERPKYQYHFLGNKKMINYPLPMGDGIVQSLGQSNNRNTRGWQYAHAPIPLDEAENGFWWKTRAERTISQLSQSGTGINSDRTGILAALQSEFTSSQRVYVTAEFLIGQDPQEERFEQRRSQAPAERDIVFDRFEPLPQSLETLNPNIRRPIRFRVIKDGVNYTSNILAPFRAYSSSVNTGYRATLENAGVVGVDFTNYHPRQISLQGPFGFQHVGGVHARHNPPLAQVDRSEIFNLSISSGTGSIVSVGPGNISAGHLTRGMTVTSPANIRNIRTTTGSISPTAGVSVIGNYKNTYEIVQTSDRRTINTDFVHNNSNYYSGGIVSSFVTSPSSRALGMTGSTDYLSSRQTGSARTNKSVIAQRFSSPGSYQDSSQLFRDPASDQLSPNNALPYRNINIRRAGNFGFMAGAGITSFLAAPAEWGGFITDINSSVYLPDLGPESLNTVFNAGNVPASFAAATSNAQGPNILSVPANGLASPFHKTQRNQTKRIKLSGESFITGSQKDNAFVTRPVPSADNFSWFLSLSGSDTTGSLNMDQYIQSGSRYPERVLVSPNSLPSSAISFGSSVITGSGTDLKYIWSLPTGFGPVSQLRAGSAPRAVHDRKHGRIHILPTNSNLSTDTKRISVNNKEKTYSDRAGNIITQRYSEEYTEPPVTAKYSPLIHTIRTYRGTPEITEYNQKMDVDVIYSYGNDMQAFANKGLNIVFGGSKKHISGKIKTPYEVIKGHYLSEVPRSITGVDKIKGFVYSEQIYPKEIHTFLSGTRTRQVFKFTAWEPDYLRPTTTVSSLSNVASLYDGSTIKTNVKTQSRLKTEFTTSQGYALRSEEQTPWYRFEDTINLSGISGAGTGSIWPMDTFMYADRVDEMLTVTAFASGGTTAGENIHLYPAAAGQMASGELMSCNYGNVIDGRGIPAAIANSGSTYYNTSSIVAAQYIYSVPNHKRLTDGTTQIDPYRPGGIATRPDWTAGLERKLVEPALGEPIYTQNRFPFYKNYESFVEDIRLISKENTIIPEFRISEHMTSYINRSNMLASFSGTISLTGASDHLTSSGQPEFMTRYSTTDFVEYLDTFMGYKTKDLQFNKAPKQFTMTSEAAVKLLPYDGFYPQTRTIEIAALFSQSYSSYVSYSGPDGDGETGHASRPERFRTILDPYYSPGILYNSIKSGIAVDHPVRRAGQTLPWNVTGSDYDPLQGALTGSWTVGMVGGGGIEPGQIPGSRRRRETGAETDFDFSAEARAGFFWSDRIPFESLLKPLDDISDLKSPLMPNDINSNMAMFVSASVLSSGSIKDVLYRSAISNFLAATPSFFLSEKPEGGHMTKIVAELPRKSPNTNPEGNQPASSTEPRTVSVNSGVAYMMEIGMRKTDQFNMYSNPYAFGPPTATGSADWYPNGTTTIPATTSSVGTVPEGKDWPLHRGEFAPFTPPYYYGPSLARITYMPQQDSEVTLTNILNSDDIYIEFLNSDGRYYDFASGSYSSLTSSAAIHGAATPNYMWNRAWQNRMDIDASIVIDNLFPTEVGGKIKPFDENKWVIMPKWECPVLDFPRDGTQLFANVGILEGGGIAAAMSGATLDMVLGGVSYNAVFENLSTTYPEDSTPTVIGIADPLIFPLKPNASNIARAIGISLNAARKENGLPILEVDITKNPITVVPMVKGDTTFSGSSTDGSITLGTLTAGTKILAVESTPYNFSASLSEDGYFNNVGEPNWTKGMWHQYGTMPSDGEGLFMYISDINNRSSEFRLAGAYVDATSANVSKVTAVKKVPLYVVQSGRTIGSLASLVGFNQEEIMPPNQWMPERAKPIGQLARNAEKTISEAIIAVPFYKDPRTGQTRAMTLRASSTALGPKIKEFRRAFTKYSLPPSLQKELAPLLPPDYPSIPDFINPFGGDDYDEMLSPGDITSVPVVYLMEHTVALSRQDLSDIWQGVMPDISTAMKVSVTSIDHYMPGVASEQGTAVFPEILEKQLDIGIPRTGKPRIDLLDTTPLMDKNGFIPEIKWMVFRAKQRGPTSYTSMIIQEINGGVSAENFNSIFGYISQDLPPGAKASLAARKNVYTQNLYQSDKLGKGRNTYNWPYDYCSIIESAKISTKVTFRPELDIEDMPEEAPGPEVLDTRDEKSSGLTMEEVLASILKGQDNRQGQARSRQDGKQRQPRPQEEIVSLAIGGSPNLNNGLRTADVPVRSDPLKKAEARRPQKSVRPKKPKANPKVGKSKPKGIPAEKGKVSKSKSLSPSKSSPKRIYKLTGQDSPKGRVGKGVIRKSPSAKYSVNLRGKFKF